MSKKLEIKEWKDWGKLSKSNLDKYHGIGRFVNRYYSGSLFRALFSIFPGKKSL